MKRLSVQYFSDYACPFCFIGETHLNRAINELGLNDDSEVQMLSFELDPTFPTHYVAPSTKLLAKKYGISMDRAREEIQKVEAMAKQSNIHLDYTNARYTSTFLAHQLTKLAQEKLSYCQANALVEEIFKAMFEKHLEMSDLDALKEIALANGLTEEDLASLEDEHYASKVRVEEELARQYGVNAVPYFIFNNKYAIPGAIGVEEMKKVITQVLEEDVQEMTGTSCLVDGCQ